MSDPLVSFVLACTLFMISLTCLLDSVLNKKKLPAGIGWGALSGVFLAWVLIHFT